MMPWRKHFLLCLYLCLAFWGSMQRAQAVCPSSKRILRELTCSDVINSRLNLNMASRLQNYSGGQCELPQPNAEDLYSFECQANGTVTLFLHNLTCDIDIYVLNSSCSPRSGCVKQSIKASNADDYVRFQCKRGQRYFVVLENYACSGSSAPYTLSFDTREGTGCPENCTNGKDDDKNGQIDCDDEVCRSHPSCATKEWGPLCSFEESNGLLSTGGPFPRPLERCRAAPRAIGT